MLLPYISSFHQTDDYIDHYKLIKSLTCIILFNFFHVVPSLAFGGGTIMTFVL